jgi:hypothetical protein
MRRERYSTAAGRWSVLAAGAALVVSGSDSSGQEWTKHFRLGMQLTLNIEAEFSMGGTFNVPFREGFYDDGYVLDDDLNAPVDGVLVTTHFGYDNAGQYSTKDNTLTFHRIDSFDVASTRHTEDDPINYGLELAYGGPIRGWRHALLGWEVGYSMLPIRISDTRAISADIFEVRDVYDTAPTGVPVIIPEPPYQGGSSGFEQPIIGREALEGKGLSGVDFFPGTISGRRTLDVTLHNFRVGPTFHYEFARRWAMQAGAGGALGIVNGDYKVREVVTPEGRAGRPNKNDITGTEFVYGGYVNGLVLFHVEDHGDIYAGVQFMSLSDSELSGEGRSAKLKLGSAFSLLLGVNWPF